MLRPGESNLIRTNGVQWYETYSNISMHRDLYAGTFSVGGAVQHKHARKGKGEIVGSAKCASRSGTCGSQHGTGKNAGERHQPRVSSTQQRDGTQQFKHGRDAQ